MRSSLHAILVALPTTFGALRGCELRNSVFSAKVQFLVKDECEFTTLFAILQNACWQKI